MTDVVTSFVGYVVSQFYFSGSFSGIHRIASEQNRDIEEAKNDRNAN